ncbi:MAG: DUF2442 domain-containing protein [Candidatus Rokubacteria bacterium]|nr:DUF2442 domain-containing protein [Candidatus Rokubacteria bacterium]
MGTSVESARALAVHVSCSSHSLSVVLADGRTISAPLAWFPRLLEATPKQRAAWKLIGGGIGIHWEAIDEDISVASLLQPENFMRLPNERMQPTREKRRAQAGRRGVRS